jgi:nitroreductase
MEFAAVVRKRRMVRSFSDEPVDAAALERILDTARRGPSAGYSQGVEFVVVTDPALLRAVGTPNGGTPKPAQAPSFVAQAPVYIVICTSAARYTTRYGESDKRAVKRDMPDDDWWHVPYWHTDAGCALMLILLATVNEGLAAGFAGVMGRTRQTSLRARLGIPDEYTVVGIVALGHAAADARSTGSARTRARRPLSEIVHRNGW